MTASAPGEGFVQAIGVARSGSELLVMPDLNYKVAEASDEPAAESETPTEPEPVVEPETEPVVEPEPEVEPEVEPVPVEPVEPEPAVEEPVEPENPLQPLLLSQQSNT